MSLQKGAHCFISAFIVKYGFLFSPASAIPLIWGTTKPLLENGQLDLRAAARYDTEDAGLEVNRSVFQSLGWSWTHFVT